MPIEKQAWIAMIKEGLVPDTSFLSRSVDMSEFVEYDKINLAEAGVDPAVLVDNTNFPVPAAQRTDTPLELPLHTFDTENTIVRNLEEKESAYPKMESVVRSHKNALVKKTASFAAYNWAPAKTSEFTPVLASSGAMNNGAKRVTFDDFLDMDSKLRALDVDMDSLVAVLNPFHLADLRSQDLKLYKDIIRDKKLFSFDLFFYSGLPYYNAATGQKIAYGSAVADTDSQCSLIYCDTEVMRAVGTTEVFAKYKDPGERGDVIGYQQRFTALSIRGKYAGAIYGGK